MSDLGTVGYGRTVGINSSGQVAGSTYTSKGWRAFVYSDGAMTVLGTLPGGSASEAIGINDSGQVTGTSYAVNGTSVTDTAFIYNAGTMISLGTLPGGSGSYAVGIDNGGLVVGDTFNSSGSVFGDGFFWTSTGGMQDLNSLIAPNSGWTLLYPEGISRNGDIVGYGIDSNNNPTNFLLTPVPEPATLCLLSLGGLGLLAKRRRWAKVES